MWEGSITALTLTTIAIIKIPNFCATANNTEKENRADESGADERHRLDGVSAVILCD